MGPFKVYLKSLTNRVSLEYILPSFIHKHIYNSMLMVGLGTDGSCKSQEKILVRILHVLILRISALYVGEKDILSHSRYANAVNLTKLSVTDITGF